MQAVPSGPSIALSESIVGFLGAIAGCDDQRLTRVEHVLQSGENIVEPYIHHDALIGPEVTHQMIKLGHCLGFVETIAEKRACEPLAGLAVAQVEPAPKADPRTRNRGGEKRCA